MQKLDPIIHSQARLKIMTTLCGLGELTSISFTRLQELTKLSSGNLSTHLAKLEKAGYIEQSKTFKHKTPLTTITLTEDGEYAYKKYLKELKKLISI